MINERESDFKDYYMLKPFYVKAVNTLRELVKVDFDLLHLYHNHITTYSEVTFENTIKLLMRVGQYFTARHHLSQVLTLVSEREEIMKVIKQKVQELSYEIDETEDEEELRGLGERLVSVGKDILEHIFKFRKASHIFDRVFIFNGKDYDQYIRRECQEVRSLLYVYDIDINIDNLSFREK